MTGLLLLLSVGGILAAATVCALTGYRLTHPPRRTYAWALSKNLPSDPSEVPPPDGPLAYDAYDLKLGAKPTPVWEIKGNNPTGPVVILTPGWASGRLSALQRVPHLLSFASRAILWDPPGHGDAPKGEPVGLGVREPKLLAALIDAVEPTDAGVVLYGWSLGAGVSIVAGARDPRVIAVIAEAPYQHPKTPARNVMRAGGYPYRWNVPILFAILGVRLGVGATWKRVYTSPTGEPQPFDRAHHAARLDCPLLVIHGCADEVCPLEDGQAIANAAKHGELLAIEGAGHNNLWSNSAWSSTVKDRITEFIERSLAPSATRSP